MNSSSLQFKDKQVMMGVPGSPKDDFYDLLNPQDDRQAKTSFNNDLAEEILPSYDFQPIRSVPPSRSVNLDETAVNVGGGPRVWSSADAKANSSNLRSSTGNHFLQRFHFSVVCYRNRFVLLVEELSGKTYGSLDTMDSANLVKEKDRDAHSSITVSEIDRTMKKHADNLLHALEGVSARLSQLESRTRHLEHSVDELKLSVGNDNGKTEGKLRQLENILREVYRLLETSKILLRLNSSFQNCRCPREISILKPKTPLHKQRRCSYQYLSNPTHRFPHQLLLLSPLNKLLLFPLSSALPPPTHQNIPPVQLPTHLPPSQIPSIPHQEPYFAPPAGPQPDATHQQYQLPPSQQPHLLPPATHQPYLSAPPQLPQYSQSPQPPQQNQPVNPSQLQPSLSRHHEETPQLPPHSYPPSVRQTPSMPVPHSGPLPSQQFYGSTPHMYESPPSRPNSGFPSGYGPPPGSNFNDPSYTGSPQYGSPSMKPHQFSSSAPSSGGGSYPRLPTAQLLPQALPTASSDSGASSGGTGNRVPIDDVVDKVSMMGFSRDQVRATVRRLTENGQSVDLNVVLDKLMNDGDVQPPKGKFLTSGIRAIGRWMGLVRRLVVIVDVGYAKPKNLSSETDYLVFKSRTLEIIASLAMLLVTSGRRWRERQPLLVGSGGSTRNNRGVTGARRRWRRDWWEEVMRGGGGCGTGGRRRCEAAVDTAVAALMVCEVGGDDD
ncbi:hypothetical protein Syun_024164 [Stephania yunnanensis]|uniref:DUF1421 domain-containing protein n=1 Tax=Stephania yunnanensis TaxID=152371 RepID=A0AAP0FJI1_9MAGN